MTYISPSPLPLQASKTITTAQVKLLNTTPIEIVAAPGAGKAIELISLNSDMTFVSAAYTANTSLILITDTALDSQASDGRILLSTGTRITRGVIIVSGPGTVNSQLVENKALNVSVSTGDPATGDSDVIINISYRIVNV